MNNRSLLAPLVLFSLPVLLSHCATEEADDDATGGAGAANAGTSGGGSGPTGGSAPGGAGSGGAGTGGVSAGTAGGGTAGAGTAGKGGSGGAGMGGTAGSMAGTEGSTGGAGAGGGGGAGAGGAAGGGAAGGGAGGALGGAGAGGASGGTGGGSGGSGGGGKFTLTSAKLDPEVEMPADFTCEGDAHSPPFEWTGVPAGTMSFAMLFVDTTIAATMPDSAMAWHHAIWDIPADVTGLPEDMPTTATVTDPVACKQFNPLGCEGYLGPCAQKEDTYEFRLYALPVATLTGTLNTVVAIRDAVMDANPLGEAVLPVFANASGTLTCPK